jgi:hypothetical protein
VSKRIQLRRGNGRFRQTELADFGIADLRFCPHCRIGNPSVFGEPRPTVCHDCGKPLDTPAATEPRERSEA